MDKTAHQLHHRVLSVIGRGVSRPTTDEEFNVLALDVFAFQFERNAAYRAFCLAGGFTPATVEHWHQLPAVPTAAFKNLEIACFDPRTAAAVFHTSGTSTAQAGKHYFSNLDLYQAAIDASFPAHLLPDNARLPMLILTPSPAQAPHSSLAHMLGRVADRFAAEAWFYVDEGELLLPRLIRDLERARAEDQPVFLLGTAFAFVHLLDHCETHQLTVSLPAGSRIMETGGFKGRTRQLPKEDLYRGLASRLGIPRRRIVNEYGMTELSTQFYDDSLLRGERSDLKRVPPWARVRLIDPQTGNATPLGLTGMIRIVDLANLGSSLCLQTEDLGVARTDGFEILGRATAAAPRGCSLHAEELTVGV